MPLPGRYRGRARRHRRVRKRVWGTPTRPRLCVFRSLRRVYAQLVDDTTGRVLLAASNLEPDLRALPNTVETAKVVGRRLAERARAREIARVVFDRAGYKYHGKVKALAEGARDGSLEF